MKGGYRLALQASDISVEEVIRALEGPIAITECVEEGSDCEIEATCPVRTNWQRINGEVREALAAIRLSEMVAGVSFAGPPGRNGRPVTEAPREVEAS